MQDAITISYSESDTKGRYGASVEGIASEAELVISKVTPDLIVAVHTFVPEELGGRGIGRALVDYVIDDARKKGQRIVPQCPYFRAYARKHKKELSDVVQW